MTTILIFVRYSDVGITSGLNHEYEEQIGRGGEAASARGAAAASRAQAGRSGQDRRRAAANRVPLARRAASRRDRCAARHEQRWTPGFVGSGGIGATADRTDGRTDRAWLWHPAVDAQAGTCVHRAPVRGAVQRRACLAPARADGFFQPEAGTARDRARRSGDHGLEEAHLAWAQKKTRREGP